MKNKKEQRVLLIKKATGIGVFGGLFWGSIWYFFHIFSFSEAGPNYMIMPFAFGDWKKGMWGNILAIVLLALLSIVTAILYGMLFKRFQGVIPGIIYGTGWWGFLFLVIGSLSPVLKSAMELPLPTVVTTLCIFIVYGAFITYSVSFEAAEENRMDAADYSNKR